MRSMWVRVCIGVGLAELLPILVLVAVVAVNGPNDATAAQAYAERMGRWVGPIAGPLCVLGLSYWAFQPRQTSQLQAGLLFGAGAVALDVGLLILAGAPFDWLFVAANTARLAAGATGGFLVRSSAD